MTPAGAAPEGGDPRSRLRAALGSATSTLAGAGIVSASVDARALLARAARWEGPLILLDALPEDFEDELALLLARRAAREPLQLILGRAPFRHLEILVRPGVFIPRPETEVAIDLVHAFAVTEEVRTVVDLCAGTGALGAAVLDELPAARVDSVELDPAAAELAAENLERAAAGHPGRFTVRCADVTDAAALADLRGIDVLVSNPPYIPAGAIPRDAEVTAWDPERALYGGGEDGLVVPAAVIARSLELLRPGGLLVMEHADLQGPGTRDLARRSGGLEGIRTARDLTGRDRFLVATRSAACPATAEAPGSEKLGR